MNDPRDLPLPTEPFQRATALARELAYGAVCGEWGVMFTVVHVIRSEYEWHTEGEQEQLQNWYGYLSERWGNNPPPVELLEVLGYAARHTVHSRDSSSYVLTAKALALLEAPAVPPTAFIGYGRQQSSAFALLIEARLAARGVKAFIDKLIEGGAEWEALIHETITQKVNHFICVIGPGTLDSPNVRNEIRWALEAGIVTIPIWHGGFSARAEEMRAYDPYIRDFVQKKNALRVIEESAANYDAVLAQLLNQLEFSAAPALDEMAR